MIRHALAVSAVWTSLAFGGPLDKTGSQWAPCVEWTLENPTVQGNPYDLVAAVAFVHEESGETRTTEMYCVGKKTWAFRFTGTRPGRWIFSTKSDDADLDGKRGTVTIEPNPDAAGFVTAFGNKWGRTGTGCAFVPQLVMYASPERFYRKPEKVAGDIQTFLVDHGFNGFHTYVACRWFDLDEMRSDRIRSHDPNPDPRTFEALELLITKTHAAGGMVHIWAWGDEARHWTPKRWGLNGKADRRLQRYIAARLGPLPGWTMGYGFDNWEWAREDDLRRWHRHLHQRFGWPHLLGCRAHKNKLTQIYEGLDYAAYEQHRPDYKTYCRTIDARPGKPAFSEDRFRIRQGGGYAYKDYTEEMTRRGLWHSTLAGGVANIWGRLDGQSSALGSKPYDHPEWIKTWSRFFDQRFRKDMVRDPELTDGACLRRPNRRHYVFYKEDAASVVLDLSAMDGPQPAFAVDTVKPYAEREIGSLPPTKLTWTAPYRSDWAIAVGESW
jgi:hypothetical protein